VDIGKWRMESGEWKFLRYTRKSKIILRKKRENFSEIYFLLNFLSKNLKYNYGKNF